MKKSQIETAIETLDDEIEMLQKVRDRLLAAKPTKAASVRKPRAVKPVQRVAETA